MASDMIKLGGLWSGKDKEGNTFLSGKFSPQVKILIFKNKYRESENHPTHIMYLSQVETQGQGQRQGGGDEPDEFFDDAAFQRGQARVAQGGHLAPEDVAPLPEDEYTAVRRSPEPMRGASSSQPRPQQARPARQPAPPPDFGEGLEDPFADDEAPAQAPQPQRPAQSPSNIGRQLFSPGDIGRNKAVVLINRINCYFGLHWAARPEVFDLRSHDRVPDVIITCVDTAAARRSISERTLEIVKRKGGAPLWLDCGNSQRSGQVMLGAFDGNSAAIPPMRQLLPEIFDASIPEDDKPSCSLAEALQSQDLFINQAIATYAGHLLWTLIREGETAVCGYWINLEEGRVVPVPVPATTGRRAGK